MVESDESRRFAGEIEMLNEHLKPIKSEARICQLLSKGFYGRQWLFEAVEKWRNPGSESRVHAAQGSESQLQAVGNRVNAELRTPPPASSGSWAPGVGKSAFADQLAHNFMEIVGLRFAEMPRLRIPTASSATMFPKRPLNQHPNNPISCQSL